MFPQQSSAEPVYSPTMVTIYNYLFLFTHYDHIPLLKLSMNNRLADYLLSIANSSNNWDIMIHISIFGVVRI